MDNDELKASVREAFKRGGSKKNPHAEGTPPWQAWENHWTLLSCHKAHGVALRICCFEHGRHMARPVTQGVMAVSSCPRCEPLAEQERFLLWKAQGKDPGAFPWVSRQANRG